MHSSGNLSLKCVRITASHWPNDMFGRTCIPLEQAQEDETIGHFQTQAVHEVK